MRNSFRISRCCNTSWAICRIYRVTLIAGADTYRVTLVGGEEGVDDKRDLCNVM